MIPLSGFSGTDTTSTKFVLIKGDTSYLTRPAAEAFYKTSVELDSCTDANNLLYSKLSVKEQAKQVSDSLLAIADSDRELFLSMLHQDTVIIRAWKRKSEQWEGKYKKEKGLKIGSIVIGSISIALNVFLPTYFILKQ